MAGPYISVLPIRNNLMSLSDYVSIKLCVVNLCMYNTVRVNHLYSRYHIQSRDSTFLYKVRNMKHLKIYLQEYVAISTRLIIGKRESLIVFDMDSNQSLCIFLIYNQFFFEILNIS